jgi:hypothetical protein
MVEAEPVAAMLKASHKPVSIEELKKRAEETAKLSIPKAQIANKEAEINFVGHEIAVKAQTKAYLEQFIRQGTVAATTNRGSKTFAWASGLASAAAIVTSIKLAFTGNARSSAALAVVGISALGAAIVAVYLDSSTIESKEEARASATEIILKGTLQCDQNHSTETFTVQKNVTFDEHVIGSASMNTACEMKKPDQIAEDLQAQLAKLNSEIENYSQKITDLQREKEELEKQIQ